MAEIRMLRSENESLKKILLLFINPHTKPSRQMIIPKMYCDLLPLILDRYSLFQ